MHCIRQKRREETAAAFFDAPLFARKNMSASLTLIKKETAMVQKHPLCPDRIRKVPKQFSWIDQRLVRDRHIDRCSHRAAALYLFLVTVADAQGLSHQLYLHSIISNLRSSWFSPFFLRYFISIIIMHGF